MLISHLVLLPSNSLRSNVRSNVRKNVRSKLRIHFRSNHHRQPQAIEHLKFLKLPYLNLCL